MAERFFQRAEQGLSGWKDRLLVGGLLVTGAGLFFRSSVVTRVGLLALGAGAAIYAYDKIKGK